MSNYNAVANTSSTNIVLVQAIFDNNGNCLGLIGPGGLPFYPPLRITTEAALGAVGNAVNTSGKQQGSLVYASDSHELYTADGSAPNAIWYRADGGTPITPA